MSTPYMPLFVGDYLADTAHLSTLEHGAYMLLIMSYWQTGKPLPATSDRRANVARMSNERWAEVEPTLVEFFAVQEDGRWVHRRIEAELARLRERSAKASASGKASGQRRANDRSTNVERSLNERSTDAELIKPSQEVSTCSTSEQEHARGEEQCLDLERGKGSGKRDVGALGRTLTARAEGLGLPVAELTAITTEAKPRSPEAYFRRLCVNRLRDKVPRCSEPMLVKALAGDREAFTLVTFALMESEARPCH